MMVSNSIPFIEMCYIMHSVYWNKLWRLEGLKDGYILVIEDIPIKNKDIKKFLNLDSY